MNGKQARRVAMALATMGVMALAGYVMMTGSRTALFWLCDIVIVGGMLTLVVLVLDAGQESGTSKEVPFTLAAFANSEHNAGPGLPTVPWQGVRCQAMRYSLQCVKRGGHGQLGEDHETAGGASWPAGKLAGADATVQLPTLAERMIRTDGKTL